MHEDSLPGPQSADARALKRRIMLSNPGEPRPRRRTRQFRVAAVGLAAAAVAFGALSVLPGEGPSAVARARAALNPSGDTILHTVVVSTRSDDPGSTTTVETWARTLPPYDERSLQIGTNARTGRTGRRELASSDGLPEHYDAATNTIYTRPPRTKLPAPRRVTHARHPLVEGDVSAIIANLRSLLRSGEAKESSRVTVGGRDATWILFPGFQMRLLVDADTGHPIEQRSVYDGGVRVTSRFQTYEQLRATSANLALLSLSAQHPGAKISPTIVVEGVGPVSEKEE